MIYGWGINDVPGDAEPTSIGHKSYGMWRDMIRRCYHGSDNIRNITYVDTTICDEWKYYSNFKDWFDKNYISGYHLDKDIIDGKMNHYSPSNCAFVPPVINSAIIDGNRGNKSTPLGVSYVSDVKSLKKYRPVISKFCKPVRNFGLTETAMQSHQIWQREKANYLGELVHLYKNSVNPNVIKGLQRRIDVLLEDMNNGRETKSISKI